MDAERVERRGFEPQTPLETQRGQATAPHKAAHAAHGAVEVRRDLYGREQRVGAVGRHA